MPPPDTLDTLAASQHGVVATRQLLALGWSKDRIARAHASGSLVPVGHGVARIAGAPHTRRATQHAALLLGGVGAALSHWTAAELLAITDPTATPPAEITVPFGRRGPSGPPDIVRVHRSRDLTDASCRTVDGLRVTDGPRTLVDLAARCTEAKVAELLAAAIRVGAATLDRVDAACTRRRGVAGVDRVARAVALLAETGTLSRSDVEVAALTAITSAGLPRPVLAYRVRDGRGRFLAEVDLAYPELRIAIEIDGFRWHSSPERKRRDEERQNRLVLAGWTVLRFSASEVRANPARIVAAIRTALTARQDG